MTQPAAVRADCQAGALHEMTVCRRCVLTWRTGTPRPACNPPTFERLRERAYQHMCADERSVAVVAGLKQDGVPADDRPARRALAESRAIFDLIVRCCEDRDLRAQLKKKPQASPAPSRGGG